MVVGVGILILLYIVFERQTISYTARYTLCLHDHDSAIVILFIYNL